MAGSDVDKGALRERMKAHRRALSDAVVESLGRLACDRAAALPEVAGAGVVLCYVGVRRELSTTSLLVARLAAGLPVAVPRVEGDQLRARSLSGLDALVPGAYGVPTCEGPDVTDDVAVCLAPGLAFTADGHRLGYGGGFYDRFLGRHAHVVPIGLCYDAQVVASLPIEPHDHPMVAVVTPTRVLRADPTPGRAGDR